MKHTREFKESAIQLVLNSNEEIKKIAEDLGVNPKMLYNWVRLTIEEDKVYNNEKIENMYLGDLISK